jgi:hypothetical protein
MKCIHCQHDAKYRERSDGRCPQCHRSFAFEPQKGDPMTDGAFAAAIERISSRGTVRFLTEHLYYEIRRRQRRAFLKSLRNAGIAAAAAMVAGLVFSLNGVLVMTVILGLFGLWLLSRSPIGERSRFPRARFDALLQRFIAAHGMPRGLIERQVPAGASPSGRELSVEEMSAYSFDRAVICDRAETVDLLLANRFHFENNCAVLAIDGYPPRAFQVVRDMLRNNPRLVVVALHDATEAGCKLAHQLRTHQSWFKDLVPVIDVGLRPVHHKSLRGQEDRRVPRRSVPASEGVSSEEAAWLAHSTLSLAVVVPEQIIKRLFRAISVVEEQQEDSGSGGGGDGSSFDVDADLDDGGGDSFG